jgi:hypothetical protein
LSFSVATVTTSVSFSQSVEESVNAVGSIVRIVHTLSFLVAVPIYTVVRSSLVAKGIGISSEPPAGKGITNAVIIGVVSGSAVVLALLIGAVIYIVRGRAPQGRGSDKEAQGKENSRSAKCPSDDSDSSNGNTETVPGFEDVMGNILTTMATALDEFPIDGQEGDLWI